MGRRDTWIGLWCCVGWLSIAAWAIPPTASADEGEGTAPGWLKRVETFVKGTDTEAAVRTPPPQPDRSTRLLDPEALLSQLEVALGGGVDAERPHRYVDADGRSVTVGSLDEVPEPHRAQAVAIEEQVSAADPASLQRTYRYKGKGGREVFTNVVESVPLAQRAKAELDLSHVPLNSDLGTQINARLSAEHARLTGSDYCEEVIAEAKAHRWEDLWHEFSPLIIAGALIVFFLLITPAMFRRVEIPDWMRTLRFAIPALAVAGVMLYSMMKTNRAISSFARRAEPCMTSTWQGLDTQKDALGAKLALLQTLRAQMEAASQIPNDGASSERGL